MANPLNNSALNSSFSTTHDESEAQSDGPPSSPFLSNVDRSYEENQENISPSKRVSRKSPARPKSPLKMETRSPRKLSNSEKRFPVKVSTSPEKRPAIEEHILTIEDVLRDNEGLTKAIQILEDEDSSLNDEHVSDETFTSLRPEYDAPNMDDTMVSTFSTFSAGMVPHKCEKRMEI